MTLNTPEVEAAPASKMKKDRHRRKVHRIKELLKSSQENAMASTTEAELDRVFNLKVPHIEDASNLDQTQGT